MHTGRCLIRDEDDGELSLEPRVPIFERGEVNLGDAGRLEWRISHFEENTSSCAIMCVKGGGKFFFSFTYLIFFEAKLSGGHTREMIQELGVLTSRSPKTISVRVFHVPSNNSTGQHLQQAVVPTYSDASQVLEMVEGLYGAAPPPPIISIPCRSIATKGHDDWDYVICTLTI